jgi:hypothetical protein
MRAAVTALTLFSAAVLAFGAHAGSRAKYLGGTRADIPSNTHGVIRLSDPVYFVYISKKTEVKIPYERIDLIEYGQKVSRRYVAAVLISPLLLTAKKRKHFLTIGFKDNHGNQQAMVFRVNKDDIRTALAALEARTGERVVYQDENARIAGKG